MRIKYHTTEDDYVAFHIFHSRHSPYARRMRIIIGLVLPVILLVVVLSQALYSHDWASAIFGVVLLTGLSVWILAGRSRQMRRITRKMFREGKNKGFIGVHELEINDYGILTKSEYGEGKISWAGIERIGTTPDYTFIFIGATKAIILPKTRIIEGDYDAFVAELTSRFTKLSDMTSTIPDITREPVYVDQKPVSCDDKRAGRHSGYGIASFLIAITVAAATFLIFIAAVIIAIAGGETVEKGNTLFFIFGICFVLAWGATFVGAGFGIAGLLTKNRKKSFAVFGLILNLLFFFSVVLIVFLAHS